jgi:RNA polymerase sigma-70 factor, ECF subfamily
VAESMTEMNAGAVASHEDERSHIRRRLLGRFQNFADVDDAIQEGYRRLHQKEIRGDLVKNRPGFVYRAARNWLIDLRRAEGRKRREQSALESESIASSIVAPSVDTDESELEHQRRMAALLEARETLDPVERRCLDLRVEGLTFREIGEQIGVPTSTAADIFGRARNNVKRYLDEHA